jgi:hypothetical protein
VAAMAPASLFRRTIIQSSRRLADNKKDVRDHSNPSVALTVERKAVILAVVNTLNPYTMQQRWIGVSVAVRFGGQKLYNGFSKLTRRFVVATTIFNMIEGTGVLI